jgi:hypothetical protein
MSPLFRKRNKKAAREAAASAELDRLSALSPDELALKILPALRRFIRPQNISKWLMRSHEDGLDASQMQLVTVVRAALLQLERTELVSATPPDKPALWKLTRLGQQVLAQGTAAQYLGQRDPVARRRRDIAVGPWPIRHADPDRRVAGAVGAVACRAASNTATTSARRVAHHYTCVA